MDIDTLKNEILATLKDEAREFYEHSKESRDFVEACAKDLAELTVALIQAADDVERQKIRHEIKIARQAAESELAKVALDAEIQSRATVKRVLDVLFSFLEKALPVIAAIL